jgi:thioredoxin-like negative regulator of GroEL
MLKLTNNMAEVALSDKSVVAFTAEWCQPCKQLKPHFAKAAVLDKNNDYFVVDVDKIDNKYIEQYNIKGIPAIFVMSNNEVVRNVSARTTESIIEEVAQ